MGLCMRPLLRRPRAAWRIAAMSLALVAVVADRSTAQGPPPWEGSGPPGDARRSGGTPIMQPTPGAERTVPRPAAKLMDAAPLPPHPLQAQFPHHDVVVCLAGCRTLPPTIAYIAPKAAAPGPDALALAEGRRPAPQLPPVQPMLVQAPRMAGLSAADGPTCIAGCGGRSTAAVQLPGSASDRPHGGGRIGQNRGGTTAGRAARGVGHVKLTATSAEPAWKAAKRRQAEARGKGRA